MPSYQVTEPHPTALPNHRIHTGRGGAGNTIRVTPAAASSSASTKSSSALSHASSASASSTTKASTGRGGAGNIHPHSCLSSYSLADEMDAQARRERGHDTWHVGRGGAGNFASVAAAAGRRKMSSGSEGSDDSSSSSGAASVRSSGFLARLSGAFERR